MRQKLTLTFLLFPLLLSAQNGIRFEQNLTLFDALKKAEAEQKLVFVDAYTTWCGPCKMMAAKVFPDSAVGAYFNERFVNLKMDMEKGEGTLVAERYKVFFFPTLLFFNGKGEVAHKAVGYHSPEEFLTLANAAADPKANLLALETRYGKGERGPDLLRNLTELRSAAFDESAGQLANEYLKTQADFASPENMDFIMRYVDDPFSDGFQFLQKNRAAFEEKFSQKNVQQKLDGIFENYLHNHSNLKPAEVEQVYKAVYPEQGEKTASRYRLDYYQQREDTPNFAQSAADHYARFPSNDADELNEIAFLFAQNVTDSAMLQTAVKWAEKSVSIRESHYNQDTLARLYLKINKKKQAAAAARRSIELAKKAGADASQMEQLLEKTNEK